MYTDNNMNSVYNNCVEFDFSMARANEFDFLLEQAADQTQYISNLITNLKQPFIDKETIHSTVTILENLISDINRNVRAYEDITF